MRLGIMAFALGVWLLQQQAALPGWTPITALAALFLGAILGLRAAPASLGRFARGAAIAASVGLGLAWAATAAKLGAADRLAPELEGRDVTLTGVVASLPQPFERGVRFELAVEDGVTAGPDAAAFRPPARCSSPGTTGSRRKSSRKCCRSVRASAGVSRCGSGCRTATRIRTVSTTRRGSSSAGSARPGTYVRAASASGWPEWCIARGT